MQYFIHGCIKILLIFISIYRRGGERYNQVCHTKSFGGGSIMVWGGISFDGRTEFVTVNNGRINADMYITSVVEPRIRNTLFSHTVICNQEC